MTEGPRSLPPSDLAPFYTVGTGRVRLLLDGRQAFPAMLDAIKSAKHEVLLEMYWVGPDSVGDRFREALVRAARRGIRVYVMYDALGSRELSRSWWRPLDAAGGRVVAYRPFWPLGGAIRLDYGRMEVRDHRKILVVDGDHGFTGGINLAEEWLPKDQGGQGWRDDMVEVIGPAARELRALFRDLWVRTTHRKGPPRQSRVTRTPTEPVWVMASRWHAARSLRFEYLRRLRRAERSIDIANSYFVPSLGVRLALYKAAARGVRVRVLVPKKSDVVLVQYASEALFDKLLRSGIEVYWMRDRMLHSKTLVIDDSFASIGSFNLDHRSFRKNLEVSIGVLDPPFAESVRQAFDRDIAASERVDPSLWRSRSVLRRGVEQVCYAFRKLL